MLDHLHWARSPRTALRPRADHRMTAASGWKCRPRTKPPRAEGAIRRKTSHHGCWRPAYRPDTDNGETRQVMSGGGRPYLTSRPHRRHPWSMATRRTPALLLILAIWANGMALCAGWAGSPAERMACCERMGSECGSVSADDCCANGEQRQNIEGAPAVVVAPPLAASGLLIAASVRQSLGSHSSSLADRPDTYLLDSVFRI
jgi:hypothetical protein